MKKQKILGIIAIVVGLILVGITGTLVFKSFNKKDISKQEPELTPEQKKIEAFKKPDVIEHKVMLKTLPRFKVKDENQGQNQ